MQAVRLQAAQNAGFGAGLVARLVEVVESKPPRKAFGMGVEEAGQRRVEGADVQRPGGRRRESTGCHGNVGQPCSCRSLISARDLQSTHWVAVGRASRRRNPISMPQVSQ